MLNRYPLWKYLIVAFTLVVGLVYSLPNIYRPDPAVQISGSSTSLVIDQATLDRAAKSITDAGIEVLGSEVGAHNGLIRLADQHAQLRAKSLVAEVLGDDYVVALNLAPTTPGWLRAIGAAPLKLGLDLSGGVHFVLEVDTASAVSKRLDVYTTDVKKKLRDEHIRGLVKLLPSQHIEAEFASAAVRDQAASALGSAVPELLRLQSERDGRFLLTLQISEKQIREMEDYAIEQNRTTLSNRVNELGVSEPLIQKQGRNRIVVELPGVQDTSTAKKILGKTANLEFRLEARYDADPADREEFEFRDSRYGQRSTALLERELIIGGDRVTGAQSSFDSQSGQPEVNIKLDSQGGLLMYRSTKENIKRRMGVLFLERKSKTIGHKLDQDGNRVPITEDYDEKKIISLATIQSALGTQFRITGLNNPGEAAELALLLRAGALAAPMKFIEERTIGPSLGADNISRGFNSTLWGFIAIAVFMTAYYMLFGAISVAALATNLVLLLSLLSVLQATLTLPGIAAIALALGMAIDANVLINERVREELRNGMSPQAAIAAGYERAFATIVDSNFTTFIVGVMLLAFGSGPIRGFAVVHCLGILTSIFSAVMVSRALVNLVYGGRARLTGLAIGQVWKPGAAAPASLKR